MGWQQHVESRAPGVLWGVAPCFLTPCKQLVSDGKQGFGMMGTNGATTQRAAE